MYYLYEYEAASDTVFILFRGRGISDSITFNGIEVGEFIPGIHPFTITPESVRSTYKQWHDSCVMKPRGLVITFSTFEDFQQWYTETYFTELL